MTRITTGTGMLALAIAILAGTLALAPAPAAAETLAGPASPPILANPNLADLVVSAAPVDTLWAIEIVVTNQGFASTDAFIVRYQHNGRTVALRPRGLAPGASVTLAFPHTSLSCAPHVITVDAENWVRELSETNNTYSEAICGL